MDAITEVLTAKDPSDLFSTLSGDELKKRYRKLARQVHPDRFTADSKARASEAFNRLSELWDELHGKTRQPASSAYTFSTKKRTYVFGEKLFVDMQSTYFPAEYRDGDDAEHVLVRFSNGPTYNEGLKTHAKALKKLNGEVPSNFQMFHPKLVDFARHRESGSNIERTVVVTSPGVSNDVTVDEFCNLADIKSVRDGLGWFIDARDMAWIFRRTLVALGTAHDVGITNGLVALDNLFIRPRDHGMFIFDWSGSKPLTDADRVDDISMAAQCMELLLDVSPGAPKQITAFLKGCQVKKLPSAAQLLGEFDDLLERLYGPRVFREFRLPDRTR